MQKIIIMEGPDRCGKTEVGKAVAEYFDIPYFKVSSEGENWRKEEGFLNALRYDQTYICEFLEQTGHSCVIDRAYPSEFVYSHIFNRHTDTDLIWELDDRFAKMGTTIVVCMRRFLPEIWDDEHVPSEKFEALHGRYELFVRNTACNVVKMYTDGEKFDCDINKQMLLLGPILSFFENKMLPRHYGDGVKVTL